MTATEQQQQQIKFKVQVDLLQCSCLENPWMEEPGRLQSMGLLRVGHD